jgi:hypothetical protein
MNSVLLQYCAPLIYVYVTSQFGMHPNLDWDKFGILNLDSMMHPNLDWESHDAILIQIWMVVTTCPDLDWDEFQIGMAIPIWIRMHSKLHNNFLCVLH